MTTSLPHTHVRLRDLSELVAGIPYMLGFPPTDSLVLFTFRRCPVLTMSTTIRVDLPKRHDVPEVAEELAAMVARNEAVAAIAVVVDDNGPEHRTLIQELRKTMADNDILLTHASWVRKVVHGEQWQCYDDPLCTGAVPDPQTSALAAAVAVAGDTTYPDREGVAAHLAPDPEEALTRRRNLLRIYREATPNPYGEAEREADLQTLGHALDKALNTYEPPTLNDHQLVRLASALTRDSIRDECLAITLTDEPEPAERLWTVLVRSLPAPERAEPAVLLAVSAYLRGSGVLAALALKIALDANPEHRTALLLDYALQMGLHPTHLKTMLTTAVLNNDDQPQTDPTPPEDTPPWDTTPEHPIPAPSPEHPTLVPSPEHLTPAPSPEHLTHVPTPGHPIPVPSPEHPTLVPSPGHPTLVPSPEHPTLAPTPGHPVPAPTPEEPRPPLPPKQPTSAQPPPSPSPKQPTSEPPTPPLNPNQPAPSQLGSEHPSLNRLSPSRLSPEHPNPSQPNPEHPGFNQPASSHPNLERSGFNQPAPSQPNLEHSSLNQLSPIQPSPNQPSPERPTPPPTPNQPVPEQPTPERLTPDRPLSESATTEPAAPPTPNQPFAEPPTTDLPTPDRPLPEPATAESSPTAPPTPKRPTTEKPTTEKPTTGESTTEEPTTERPPAEQPATDEPTPEPSTTNPKPPKPTPPEKTNHTSTKHRTAPTLPQHSTTTLAPTEAPQPPATQRSATTTSIPNNTAPATRTTTQNEQPESPPDPTPDSAPKPNQATPSTPDTSAELTMVGGSAPPPTPAKPRADNDPPEQPWTIPRRVIPSPKPPTDVQADAATRPTAHNPQPAMALSAPGTAPGALSQRAATKLGITPTVMDALTAFLPLGMEPPRTEPAFTERSGPG